MGATAVQGLSFPVEAGGIAGPNGLGKSPLLARVSGAGAEGAGFFQRGWLAFGALSGQTLIGMVKKGAREGKPSPQAWAGFKPS